MARIDLNLVTVGGRLTKKPELRYTPNQKPVTNFTIANNQGEYNGQETVNFIEVVVWGNQATNVANFLDKGRYVVVEGAIQTRNYEGQDGKRVYVTEILARRVHFMDFGQNNNSENPSGQQNNYQSEGSAGYGGSTGTTGSSQNTSTAPNDAPGGGIVLDISDDDIPF